MMKEILCEQEQYTNPSTDMNTVAQRRAPQEDEGARGRTPAAPRAEENSARTKTRMNRQAAVLQDPKSWSSLRWKI